MKKILSLYVFMLAYALFIFQACRKDVVPTHTQSPNRELTIADPRSHFDKEYSIKSPTNFGNFFSRIDTGKQKQPKWVGAQQRVLKSGHAAVLVPLHKPGAYIQVTEKKMARFGFVNYVMMYRDSSGAIMTDWVELFLGT